MKRLENIVAGLALAAFLSGCSDAAEDTPRTRAIEFSISRTSDSGSSRAAMVSPPVFGDGDAIGVFACYTPPAAGSGSTPAFTSNFMRNQKVAFDGSAWSYSPVKYWPMDGTVDFRAYFPHDTRYNGVDDGLLTINYECRTGLDPLYAASAGVKAEKGELSGDGIGTADRLRLCFTPLLNKVNFTAKADDGLFDEIEAEEYKDCRFLIKEFRIWGFYGKADCTIADGAWSGQSRPYTAAEPLDMTQHLAFSDFEKDVPGYAYNPSEGYCTEKAVVIKEAADAINIFGKSAYFIPMDGTIPGNDPGFEIIYVVLTNKQGETSYKESGTVTRTGSLREIFADNSGLIKKIINVNLTFTVDGVTVTRDLSDYTYKPMF